MSVVRALLNCRLHLGLIVFCRHLQILWIVWTWCLADIFILSWQNIFFNPKNCGGGRILPGAQEIACHFSQDHTMVTKFLDFIKKHPKYKVVKSFFYYLDRCSRNSAETEPRSWFFGIENHKIDFFSTFLQQSPQILFQIWMTIVLSFLLRCITFV